MARFQGPLTTFDAFFNCISRKAKQTVEKAFKLAGIYYGIIRNHREMLVSMTYNGEGNKNLAAFYQSKRKRKSRLGDAIAYLNVIYK